MPTGSPNPKELAYDALLRFQDETRVKTLFEPTGTRAGRFLPVYAVPNPRGCKCFPN